MDGRQQEEATERYTYYLTESESELIDAMRKEKQTGSNTQTLSIVGWWGDRDLGLYPISTDNIVMECAKAGADIRARWLDCDAQAQTQTQKPDVPLALETGSQGDSAISLDDEYEGENVSWQEFRANIIPSCVRTVTFTINGSAETSGLRKFFSERFPGVWIQSHDTRSASPITEKRALSDPVSSIEPCQNNVNLSESPLQQALDGTVDLIGESKHENTVVQELPWQPNGSISKSLDTPTDPDSVSPSIILTAKSMDLILAHPGMVEQMFNRWAVNRSIPTFAAFTMDKSMKKSERQLQDYYHCLVDLYILADRVGNSDLKYKLLLTYQETSQAQRGEMPDIDSSVKLFKYIPAQSPLCQWVLFLFAHLWETGNSGTFDELREINQGMDLEALAKFLHGVALVRCAYTPGRDVAVLERWCDVHTHKPNSVDAKLCEKYRKRHQSFLATEKMKEQQLELDEAKLLLEQNASRPARRKRKANDEDNEQPQKSKKAKTVKKEVGKKPREGEKRLDWSRFKNS